MPSSEAETILPAKPIENKQDQSNPKKLKGSQEKSVDADNFLVLVKSPKHLLYRSKKYFSIKFPWHEYFKRFRFGFLDYDANLSVFWESQTVHCESIQCRFTKSVVKICHKKNSAKCLQDFTGNAERF